MAARGKIRKKGGGAERVSRAAMTYDKKSHFRCTLRAVGHAR